MVISPFDLTLYTNGGRPDRHGERGSVRGLYSAFTPSHRGGSGPPLVLLHGFIDTWRVWELVLPALARHHDVLALTMAGHAGGPPIEGEITHDVLAGAAGAGAAAAMIDHALREAWSLDAERITCPVRIVWGTEDRLLPWPSAAARYRRDWLPNADWVVLDGVGHAPQLDVPLETAQLILGFSREAAGWSG